jgi:sugar/nucleoside kinase (ribokinase family)
MAVDLPRIAEPGQVVYATREIGAFIGGHPIDVVIDLAEMDTPASLALVAAIGNGIYASYVSDVIDRYDFETYLQSVTTRDTGRNLVLEVTGEDRRFHIDPGANWELDPGFVAHAISAFQPHLLSIRPGYTGIDLHLAEILGATKDALILLDVMQPHPDRRRDLVLPALEHVAMVHCNEREAIITTGSPDLEGAIDVFLEKGVEVVFITSGERGARVVTADHALSQVAFEVETMDATGCGDAFCAGIIDFLVELESPPMRSTLSRLGSKDLTEMLARAQATGASAATRVGCVAGVSEETVDLIWAHQAKEVLESTRVSRR